MSERIATEVPPKKLSKPGDYCRSHKDNGRDGDLIGCSGKGRPSCQAVECLYGAEPCPVGNHWKPEGGKCNFCPTATDKKSNHVVKKA